MATPSAKLTPPEASARGFGRTSRTDTWWLAPLSVFLGLLTFIVYSTWAAFQGAHYHHGPYLSPFYSPELFGTSDHNWFGAFPSWWPAFLPASPAFLILWAPAGFRLTCYYYRKAYYRAYFLDPPACAVGEFHEGGYKGETAFPLILQNLHRYFLYLALTFLVFLWYDAVKAFFFADGLGLGVGTLVLVANSTLLSGYTLGCHSFRHLVGGKLNWFSRSPLRYRVWCQVSCLNARHQLWAWMSLFGVGFADLYVRLCSMGVWTDVRIF